MGVIRKGQMSKLGYDFIDSKYIPDGKDEYYLRFNQSDNKKYRNLTDDEIQVLISNQNTSDNWGNVLVSELFTPKLIRNSSFWGLVRIGNLEELFLDYHDMRAPVGIYNSIIISSDLGNNVSLTNVSYLSHYVIEEEVILFNVNEMQVSNHAKFGNGVISDDEVESSRIWMEISNENGGRAVLPFDGMLTSDAYIWSKYRDNTTLLNRLKEITQESFGFKRGVYGFVGRETVIKNCLIIKDVNIGEAAYIKGANKLKNLTINSSLDSKTQIGEGVELVNGIIGKGCHIFYGVKAVRFILGNNSSLKYGARLINSILGENSTISCCEVLNCLIYPGYEQHHNNSFLISATIQGQSNIAAGATIGSNHNSRAADGEIFAKRGFWPGLSVSFKHNSRFSSFVLVAKGSYSYELNISFPFSLVSLSEDNSSLQIAPAYWWLYNMYALCRNSWKLSKRDKRKYKHQIYEFDYLAPDTVEEIFFALNKLEKLALEEYKNLVSNNKIDANNNILTGKDVLLDDKINLSEISVDGGVFEAAKRKTIILKPAKAYYAYKEMVLFFAVKTILDNANNKSVGVNDIINSFSGEKRSEWINLGGQIIKKSDEETLKNDICSGLLNSWDDIHSRYTTLNDKYSIDKLNYAIACLIDLYKLSSKHDLIANWHTYLATFKGLCSQVIERSFESRNKDYHNKFRKITYDNDAELIAVLGDINDNDFLNEQRLELEKYLK